MLSIKKLEALCETATDPSVRAQDAEHTAKPQTTVPSP